jgi:hypothetical protein
MNATCADRCRFAVLRGFPRSRLEDVSPDSASWFSCEDQLASESGRALHLEPIQMRNRESCLFDEPIDLPIQVTPAADDVLNGIQQILPGCNALVLAPAML